MPQKEQIPKHEWVSVKKRSYLHQCKNCKVVMNKLLDDTLYFLKGKMSKEEPPCITRKISTNGEDSNKA